MAEGGERFERLEPAARAEMMRRLDLFRATIAATRELLDLRAPVAAAVTSLDETLRSRWWIAIAVAGGLLVWAGDNVPALSWLRSIGILILLFGGGAYVNSLLEHIAQSRTLSSIDGRLWDQRDRWRSIGCRDSDFVDLREMHTDNGWIDRGSNEYGEWLSAAMQELERRVRDGLSG